MTSILLLVLVSSVYYATASGITSSNDGSHYALLRAITDERQFEIDSFVEYTEDLDVSVRGGRFFSVRAPGTAFLAVPFYAAAGCFPYPLAELPSKHDRGNPRLAYLLMLPALAGAGAVTIVYRLLRSYDLSVFASLTASVAFAFGTINWKYGSLLYSHSLSAFLLIWGIYLALVIVRAGRLHIWPAFLLGFVLGLSVLVEYSCAVFLLVVSGYVAIRLSRRLFSDQGWWRSVLALAIGTGLPVGLLMWYDTINFGSPLTSPYAFVTTYAFGRSPATIYTMPLLKGLVGVLWYGLDGLGVDNQGLFLLMPVALIGLAGIWPYMRRQPRESILVLGVFLIYLLTTAKMINFHAGSSDGRYLAPYLGLWAVPIGFALDAFQRLDINSTLRTVLSLLIYGLLYISVCNIGVLIGYSYNYTLDLAALAQNIATPSNWQYLLGAIFVNWRNVPLLWLIWGGVLLVSIGSIFVWQARGEILISWLKERVPRHLYSPLACGSAALAIVAGSFGVWSYFPPARQIPASPDRDQPLGLTYESYAELASIYPPLAHTRPGETVRIVLTWRALQPTPDRLMVFLHSLGEPVVRYDSPPSGGNLLSTNWLPGQTWADMIVAEIPSDAPEQVVYPLTAGLYDPQASRVLSATDREGKEILPLVGKIVVNGPAQPFEPDYRFGDIIGLAEPEVTHEGNNLQVCLRWVSLAPTSTDYHVFVHALSGEDEPLVQADFQPKDGLYPTSVWTVGEAIDDCVTLGAASLTDKWKVAIGLYEFESGLRLPVVDRDGLLLDNGMVVITPQ
ncbi:MAG: hypothetical protein JXB30_09835 [Anaerolineae bacterium]|nr:hypothetical protein [Anaerolineae bacterium]